MHWAPASGAGGDGEVGGFCLPFQEAVGALHNIPPTQHGGRTARARVFFFNLGLNSSCANHVAVMASVRATCQAKPSSVTQFTCTLFLHSQLRQRKG